MYKDNDTLLKRARAKYISKKVSIGLLKNNPDSPLKNSYYGSLLCTHNLHQSGHKLTSSYCKQRWCAVCNRIRTAKLITGYVPVLNELIQPYFVTLTKKTVSANELSGSIDLMEKTWRKILHSDAGKRRKIKGIRKCECTIRPNGQYHYHYHVIVEGKESAEWLVNAWLQRLPDSTDVKAQDCKPADDNSLKEMFKYFTKLLIATGPNTKEFYPTKRMDVIFQAMKGKRVIQSFGGFSPVSDDIDELSGQVYSLLEGDIDVWKWKDTDWYNTAGQALTGYTPTQKFKEIVDKLVTNESEN